MKVFHRHARKCQMNSSNEGATQGQTSYGSVGDPSIFFFFSEGITVFLLHIAEREGTAWDLLQSRCQLLHGE